jgi:dihydrodipicolinate synthase/N-acetylneuraminate lyase
MLLEQVQQRAVGAGVDRVVGAGSTGRSARFSSRERVS